MIIINCELTFVFVIKRVIARNLGESCMLKLERLKTTVIILLYQVLCMSQKFLILIGFSSYFEKLLQATYTSML